MVRSRACLNFGRVCPWSNSAKILAGHPPPWIAPIPMNRCSPPLDTPGDPQCLRIWPHQRHGAYDIQKDNRRGDWRVRQPPTRTMHLGPGGLTHHTDCCTKQAGSPSKTVRIQPPKSTCSPSRHPRHPSGGSTLSPWSSFRNDSRLLAIRLLRQRRGTTSRLGPPSNRMDDLALRRAIGPDRQPRINRSPCPTTWLGFHEGLPREARVLVDLPCRRADPHCRRQRA